MVKKLKENTEEITPNTSKTKFINIDISKLYEFEQSDVVIEIAEEHYSNLAYIQVTPRDVYIDFLPMPGVKKDGKMLIKGTRIFMPLPAAQRLAEVLGRVLESAYEGNAMEAYQPPDAKEAETKSK